MSIKINDRAKNPTASNPSIMIRESTKEILLPYGTKDLDSQVVCLRRFPRRVRCFVRGCRHILRTPTRYDKQGLPLQYPFDTASTRTPRS